MKVYGIAKRAVLLTAALLVCAAGWAQNSISALVFDEYEWDFGTLREVDGPVSHSFSGAMVRVTIARRSSTDPLTVRRSLRASRWTAVVPQSITAANR